MYTSATNNVIWRISTGKRTRQDDPELIDLTSRIVENFKTMDPSGPLNLIQMNSLPFAKLCRFLGIPNFLSSSKKVVDMISDEVHGSSANESGNFIQRALSEREQDQVNGVKSLLAEPDGKQRIVSQLTELFVAGTLILF